MIPNFGEEKRARFFCAYSIWQVSVWSTRIRKHNGQQQRAVMTHCDEQVQAHDDYWDRLRATIAAQLAKPEKRKVI